MGSVVRSSHYVYKSIGSPVIEQLLLEKEPAANLHDKFAMAVIKDSQIVGCTLSENLFTDHVILYYMKGRCHLLSSIYHITGRRRKGKGL